MNPFRFSDGILLGMPSEKPIGNTHMTHMIYPKTYDVIVVGGGHV